MRRAIYASRPYDDEDRAAMTAWNKLESQCDNDNAKAMSEMDLSHLNKTRTNQAMAATKRWSKDNKRQSKLLQDKKKLPNSIMSYPRTWIKRVA